FVDLIVHLFSQESNVAVAVKKVTSPTVATGELIDVSIGVAGAVSLARVPQDHSRAVLLDACPRIGFKRIRSTRPHIRTGDRPGPRRHTTALLQAHRSLTDHERLAQPIGDRHERHITPAKEDAFAINAWLTNPVDADVI